MSEIESLLEEIEMLRKNLYEIVGLGNNLQDPEIIAASQILDATLTKYNEIIMKKLKASNTSNDA